MNPNTDTWQDRAKKYLSAIKNPATDIHYMHDLKKSLDWVNMNQEKPEDKKLIWEVFNS